MKFWSKFKEGTICRCVGRSEGINRECWGIQETSHSRKPFLLLDWKGSQESGVRADEELLQEELLSVMGWVRTPVIWGLGEQEMWPMQGLVRCWGNKCSSPFQFRIISSHVWMWELDYKESWVQNWCFWTMVLEKTFESPLDCKEIQPVHPKGDQSWVFIGRTDAEDETPVLWPPDGKSWLIWKNPDAGKDWRQEEKGTTEDEMVGWHHQLNGHEFE